MSDALTSIAFRRLQSISNHLITYEPSYTTPNFVNNGDKEPPGLKTLYNRYLKGRALGKIKEVIQKRNPKNIGTLETIFIWLTIVLVSLPWLSYILLLSFLKITRQQKVSMINAWARFVLTKVKIFLSSKPPNNPKLI